MSRFPDWRRALVLTHRWMGIVGGLLVIAWFGSGIVMMYARMPELDEAERLALAPALDVSTLAVSPVEAAGAAGVPDASAAGARLGMLADRPAYRVGGTAVFADTGAPLAPFTPDEALALVARLVPEHAASLSHDGHLAAPDQWTLQSRGALPLHRIALGDAEGTRLYLSDRTGDVVMETKAAERRWAYAGAVLHWLYFTPFRAQSALWAQTIIWLSIAGCLLTLSGLVWGLMRFSWRRASPNGRSPYAGLLRWHHYAGLVFGLFTFTWMLSGGLSMDPWSWHPGTAPTRAQREGVAGGPIRIDGLTAEQVRRAAEALTARSPGAPGGFEVLKEISFGQLHGALHVVGTGTGGRPRAVAVGSDSARAFARFSDDEMMEAARAAMPDVPIVDVTWLSEHDAYYYGRGADGAGPPLPVLRVRFDDPQETWLYLDPGRGQIALKHERLTRLNRWLYQGLHSLDFPGFYASRPLWDIVVIVLSLGGIALAATTLLPGWRRMARLMRRGGR